VHNHKVAGREFKAYNPYPQPQSYSPVRNRSLVVNNVGSEKLKQGVVKRGGATVKWLSPEQSMAKMEGMRRHEEQLHKAEKDRVIHHVQTQHASTNYSPNAGRSEPATSTPNVITVQGTKFQVSSGGSKLLRFSGTSTRPQIRSPLTQKSQTSLLWPWLHQKRSVSMVSLSSAPKMAT
jgi:hypothetical protein